MSAAVANVYLPLDDVTDDGITVGSPLNATREGVRRATLAPFGKGASMRPDTSRGLVTLFRCIVFYSLCFTAIACVLLT